MDARVAWSAAALAIAGIGLWLLLAGPGRLFGVDTGIVGVVLLAAAVWTALFHIGRTPAETFDAFGSPAEWRAWVGIVFMAFAAVYFVANLSVFDTASIIGNEAARHVGNNLVLLLIAWSVVGRVLSQRWKGRVQQDERDHRIAARATGWSRGALVVVVVAVAVALGFSPPDRLQWATYPMIANLLMLGLIASVLVEHATTVVLYWRDRR